MLKQAEGNPGRLILLRGVLAELFCQLMISKPKRDDRRYQRVLHEFACAKRGSYVMSP